MKDKRLYALLGGFLILSMLAGCAPLPPEMELAVTVSPGVFSSAGQVLTFNYVVKNVGDMGATISVHDTKLGAVCGAGEFFLGAGATKTCQATYSVTNADVTAGQIATTASATGVVDAGYAVSNVAQVTDSVVATLYVPSSNNPETPSYPELTLTISSSQDCYVKANEIITYMYSITNTGYKALEGPFTIVDDRIDEWDCPYIDGFTLDVGMTLDCHGYYKVRSGDVGAVISNLAHAEVLYEGQTILSNEVGLNMCFGGVNSVPIPPKKFPTVISPGG